MLSDPRLIPLLIVVVLAVVARLARALTTGGAIAGAVVGVAVALGHEAAGIGVLGVFFVAGSVATKLGWQTKSEEGTAERGGGARDAQRVIGKGGAAALASALAAAGVGEVDALVAALVGALAAALADTLGTEIGLLSKGTPRRLPTFISVPRGTPGAVSVQGTAASAVGAAIIATAAWGVGLLTPTQAGVAAAAGFTGALVESVVTSMAPSIRSVPGWVRNVLTTGVGAALAFLGAGALR